MVTLITLVLNPVRPDSSVGPGFNPQSGHLSVLIVVVAAVEAGGSWRRGREVGEASVAHQCNEKIEPN